MSHGYAPQVPDNKPQRFCSDDRTPLTKTHDPRGNVTFDLCTTCGIILLDPGELERIIATVASQPGFRPAPHLVHGSPQYAAPAPYRHHGDSSDRRGHGGYHHGSSSDRRHGHRGHRDSFLGELFD